MPRPVPAPPARRSLPGLPSPSGGCRARAGWSLLEVLLVVMLSALLMGFALVSQRRSPAQLVDDEAALLLRAMTAARSGAVLRQEDALLVVEPAAGRYAATSVPVGSGSEAVESSAWHVLSTGVRFGIGSVTTGPMGDSVTTAVPQSTVRCTMDGACELGAWPLVTYYLTAIGQPTAVRAVTIGQTGDARLFRYVAETNTWE